jgi:rhodanese-related sulfurtransferase
MSFSADDLEVDAEQVSRWLAEDHAFQVIDVREVYEREAGHISGSRHIELAQLSGQAGSIDPGLPVVFYCRLGARSLMAAQAFRASDFDAYSLRGGLVKWVSDHNPIVPDGGHVADH